jgi:hypothetical protein
MWPNNLSFLFLMMSIIVSSFDNFFLISSFRTISYQLILRTRRKHLISNASSFFLSASFRVHVSDAYTRTLNKHVVRILSLFSSFSFSLFHVCLKEAIAPVAFPILLFISSEQFLSHVSRLPRYSNFPRFLWYFLLFRCYYRSSCLQIPWFWFYLYLQ